MNYQKRLTLLISVASLTALNQPVIAFPFYGKYLPRTSTPIGRKYKMKQIAEDLRFDTTLKVGNMSINCHDYQVDIIGTDDFGGKWLVTQNSTIAGGYMYSADLDSNGKQDLIICMGTGACGIAPATHICFIMTDINGHPTSYDITGDFQYGPSGIEDLRSIQKTKGAVLIQQFLASDVKNQRNYWKTTAWNAHAGGWIPLRKLANYDLPEYVAYAFKEHHIVARPNPKADVDGNDGMVRRKAKPQPLKKDPQPAAPPPMVIPKAKSPSPDMTMPTSSPDQKRLLIEGEPDAPSTQPPGASPGPTPKP